MNIFTHKERSAMNFAFLEMIYNILELQDLSYQIYRQIPNRVEEEENFRQVWSKCAAAPDCDTQKLFLRLEDAFNRTGSLHSWAAFFAGAFFIWNLLRAMEQI